MALDRLQQRKGWTLQLVAGKLEQTVINVINRSPEDARLSYTLGERQGEPWFMLVYGVFDTREDAAAASASLPGVLGIRQPWIRSYESF
ncbi:SPOR domain-containing protein [Marinobacter sp.]|uniref:SPOR domain-containing protein n=1 Tax=Marinobacter sp. TaxID=50741 RepID=UPI003562691E